MKDDITIPPEALEAAAIDLHRSMCGTYCYSWAYLESDTRDVFRNHARAACLAMIKAWPGATSYGPPSSGHGPSRTQLILPLPQKEPTND